MKPISNFIAEELERGVIARLMKDISNPEHLNEMGPKTYALLHNSTTHARDEIQKGNDTKQKRGEIVSRYDDIERANDMDAEAKQHFLKKYLGKTFAFFGRTRTQLVATVTFTFIELYQLDNTKAILRGEVTFNRSKLNGDIIYDFKKSSCYYKEKKSQYRYTLEPNNNVKTLWDSLIEDLKETLKERKE